MGHSWHLRMLKKLTLFSEKCFKYIMFWNIDRSPSYLTLSCIPFLHTLLLAYSPRPNFIIFSHFPEAHGFHCLCQLCSVWRCTSNFPTHLNVSSSPFQLVTPYPHFQVSVSASLLTLRPRISTHSCLHCSPHLVHKPSAYETVVRYCLYVSVVKLVKTNILVIVCQ